MFWILLIMFATVMAFLWRLVDRTDEILDKLKDIEEELWQDDGKEKH